MDLVQAALYQVERTIGLTRVQEFVTVGVECSQQAAQGIVDLVRDTCSCHTNEIFSP